MSRLRSAETASFWAGSFEPRRRDIDGATIEAWAADERRERMAADGHGITESELRQLFDHPAGRPLRRLAA